MALETFAAPVIRREPLRQPDEPAGLVHASGFRHFLQAPGGQGAPEEADITPPLFDGDAVADDALRLFKRRSRRLALAMSGYRAASASAGQSPSHDNPAIPAGYTYLLQFLAHDLVASSIPPSQDQGQWLATRDARLLPLRLDSLYGAGPLLSPHAYEMEWPPDGLRSYLRLGPALVGKETVLRDVPRQFIYPHDRIAREKPSHCTRTRETLLADPRNDDNGLLSQLVTLFILLHNAVLSRLSARRPANGNADSAGPASLEVARNFETARAIVTIVYRQIIRKDVLPRILHPDVFKLYAAAGNAIIDRAGAAGDLRPVKEFTLAAFRFGHAMLRESYQLRPGDNPFTLKQLLEQSSSAANPVQIPPTLEWLIAWSRFFDIDSVNPPQPSRLIQPGTDLTQVVLGQGGKPPAEEGDVAGLEFADLLSGGLARLWRLAPLAAAIGRHPAFKPLVDGSELLSDAGRREFAIREWLGAFVPAAPGHEDTRLEDIRALAAEPPLPFFIRFEASWPGPGGGNGGTHLGLLGSILSAETFYAALHGTALPEEKTTDPLGAAVRFRLGDEQVAWLGPDLLAPLRKVRTMADLARQVALLARPAGPSFLG